MLLVAMATTTCLLTSHLAQCQLLQAQSHLGRLVQSITSPLVLSAAGYDTPHSSESDDSPAPNSFGGPLADSPLSGLLPEPSTSYNNMPSLPSSADETSPVSEPQHFQRYKEQEQQQQQEQQHQYQPSRANVQQQQQQQQQHHQQQHQQKQLYHHQQALQQAPSQERGIPQHYYASKSRPVLGGAHDNGQTNDDEDIGAPSSPARKQHLAAQNYRMGAYLGPTIDEKEIQGAFNSNSDDKDDDEGSSASYMGGASGNHGADNRQRAAGGYGSAAEAGPYRGASESSYGQPGGEGGFGPPEMASYGAARSHGAFADGGNRHQGPRDDSGPSFNDDSGADEDDESTAGRAADRQYTPRFRTSSSPALSQAASDYNQRRQRNRSHGSSGGGNQQQMLAAANGYAPFGYANGGPIDLSSLMAGGPGAYEVYNGDGSYPGQDYYQQQGNNNGGRSGRHSQAASSMMNNNGAGPYGYNNGQQQQQQRNQANDNDDQDEGDDD